MSCQFWIWRMGKPPRCEIWRDLETAILKCPLLCAGDVRRCGPAVELSRRECERLMHDAEVPAYLERRRQGCDVPEAFYQAFIDSEAK